MKIMLRFLLLAAVFFLFNINSGDSTFTSTELAEFQRRNYEEQLRFREKTAQLAQAGHAATQAVGGIFTFFSMMRAKEECLKIADEIEENNKKGAGFVSELEGANLRLQKKLAELEYLDMLASAQLVLPIEIEVYKSKSSGEIVRRLVCNVRRIEDGIGMLHGYAIARKKSFDGLGYSDKELLAEIQRGEEHHNRLNEFRLNGLINCELIGMGHKAAFSKLKFMLGDEESHSSSYAYERHVAESDACRRYVTELAKVLIRIKKREFDAKGWQGISDKIFHSIEMERQKILNECIADLNFSISVYDRTSGVCLYKGL